jgi:hypothetical protein
VSGAGEVQELGYLDFDVLLEKAAAGAYQARVVNAPAGLPAPVPFSMPLSPLEVENFLLRVGRPRRGTARRIDSPESAAVKAFGGQLFAALFHDDLRESLLRSLGEAEHQQRGLRIRLRLSECPELAELPWEFLYDQQRNRFLNLSRHTPLVRYLALPDPPRSLAVSPPLRVLVMIASPNGYPELDVEQEWGKLKEALGGLEQAGRVELERLELATLAAMHHRLRGSDAYHIFHFIGHGGFDPQRQDGLLLFEDKQGKEFAVSGEKLGTLLNDHDPMRLVVLNACEGARGDATDPFAGTAQSLMQQGLPAVVAMQFEITDEAAIIFAHELYAAVADGLPLDGALSEARRAIFFTGNAVEWGTPVLYMRAPDGRIFELDRTSATEPRPRLRVSPTEVDLGKLTRGTDPPARIVQLHNAGGGQLNARVETSEPWIQVQKLDGRVQLRIDTAVVGSLDGEVRVRSDGGDASVRVRAQVQPGPTLAVEPRLVDFGRLAVGAHPEVLVRVGNTGRGELEWTHRSSGSFFRTERVPEGLRLRLDAGAPGRHRGSISVGSNGGDVVLQVLADLVGTQPVPPRPVRPGPRRPSRGGVGAVGAAASRAAGANAHRANAHHPREPRRRRRRLRDGVHPHRHGGSVHARHARAVPRCRRRQRPAGAEAVGPAPGFRAVLGVGRRRAARRTGDGVRVHGGGAGGRTADRRLPRPAGRRLRGARHRRRHGPPLPGRRRATGPGGPLRPWPAALQGEARAHPEAAVDLTDRRHGPSSGHEGKPLIPGSTSARPG